VASLCACSSEPVERPPLASDRCGGELCTLQPRMGIAGGVDAIDAGDALQSGDDQQGSMSFDVAVATRADASQSRPLGSEAIEVVIDAADGARTELDYDGGESESIAPGPAPFWFRLRPLDDSDLMTTLLPVPEARSLLGLFVFERRVFQDVADNLAIPVDLSADRGHAVLLFTRDGLPLPGVSVSVPEGRVAYDAGTLFSDGVEVTQERGAAALLNLPAVPFPGGSSELEVTFLGETVLLEIELCRDAVTLVTLPL
jgi:hypothetical protein